jgi:hypothetical protein
MVGTFKIITLAASLEEKTINLFDDYYYDGGSAKNYKAPKNEEFEGCAKIHMYEKGKQVLKYIDRAFITKDEELIDT